MYDLASPQPFRLLLRVAVIRSRRVAGPTSLALLLAGLGGCDAGEPTGESVGEPARGTAVPTGKADGLATCESSCGDQAPAGCWCDSTCVEYGDCCSDYAPVCEGAPDHAVSDEAELVADSEIARYRSGFRSLYAGDVAFVPYLRDDINYPTVGVRKYVWDGESGMVDGGAVETERQPRAIGLSPLGGLASAAGQVLSLAGVDDFGIPGLANPGFGEGPEGHILADAGGGRLFVSYEHGAFHTQIVDLRGTADLTLAGTLRGQTTSVRGQRAATADYGRVRVYDITDAYDPLLTADIALPGNLPHTELYDGAMLVLRNTPEIEVRGVDSGSLLRTLPLPEVANGAVHRRGDLLFLASATTVYVVDASDPTDPTSIDTLAMPGGLGVEALYGLSGSGDLLHCWATDQRWDSQGSYVNSPMRVITWRLPDYANG